jgi:hypothetical protein
MALSDVRSARSRVSFFPLISAGLVGLQAAAWYLPAGPRAPVYGAFLALVYIVVLLSLILLYRHRHAMMIGLGFLCSMPVAGVYLVLALLNGPRSS